MYRNDRIKLRGFRKEDASKLVELRDDFDAVKSFIGSPFPVNLQTEEEWISNMYPPGLKEKIYLVAEEMETGVFIGYCIANKINYINRNSEVGFIFHKDSRGKGFFRDVNVLFYNYLFNEINLFKVYTFVLVENKKALDMYLKLGFKIEGEIKEHIYQDGKYKDVYFVSLYSNNFHFKKSNI